MAPTEDADIIWDRTTRNYARK